jgi:hypothetical protein
MVQFLTLHSDSLATTAVARERVAAGPRPMAAVAVPP